jgi:hypothetical protein
MIIFLSILAALGWAAAISLYLSRRRERIKQARYAGARFAHSVKQGREIAYWREQANKHSRNTGKAEH